MIAKVAHQPRGASPARTRSATGRAFPTKDGAVAAARGTAAALVSAGDAAQQAASAAIAEVAAVIAERLLGYTPSEIGADAQWQRLVDKVKGAPPQWPHDLEGTLKKLADAKPDLVQDLVTEVTTLTSLRQGLASTSLEMLKLFAASMESLGRIDFRLDTLGTVVANQPSFSKEQSDAQTRRRGNAMLEELESTPGASIEAYAELLAGGESARVAWTKNGALVSSPSLAKAWGLSRQGVMEAVARHELFLLKIRGRLWAPAAFSKLSRDDVKAVCSEMPDADPESQFFFWSRPHGGLGGKTAAQAIRDGKLRRVVEIARGLAEENGWSRARQIA